MLSSEGRSASSPVTGDLDAVPAAPGERMAQAVMMCAMSVTVSFELRERGARGVDASV